MFKTEALEYLIRCKSRLESVPHEILKKCVVGKSATKWFESVRDSDNWPNCDCNSSNWEISGLSTDPLDRVELQQILSEAISGKSISHEVIKKCVIEIFAWGTMRVHNARSALPCIENYQEICVDLICRKLNSVEAYREFFIANHSKEILGMGPAYYTKLIYFLGDQTGLILDQWTGRSINTLCINPVINLDNGYVSKSNGPKRYAKYLETVEQLRVELNLQTLSQTEELIYSCSDQNGNVRLGEENHKICSAWRKFVKTRHKVLRSPN